MSPSAVSFEVYIYIYICLCICVYTQGTNLYSWELDHAILFNTHDNNPNNPNSPGSVHTAAMHNPSVSLSVALSGSGPSQQRVGDPKSVNNINKVDKSEWNGQSEPKTGPFDISSIDFRALRKGRVPVFYEYVYVICYVTLCYAHMC